MGIDFVLLFSLSTRFMGFKLQHEEKEYPHQPYGFGYNIEGMLTLLDLLLYRRSNVPS